MSRGANQKEKVLAMYRGDTLVGVGTYKELSKITGMTPACLRSLKSRQEEFNHLVIIEVNEDEEDSDDN